MPWLERGCYAGVRGACVGFTCGLLGLVEEWGGSAVRRAPRARPHRSRSCPHLLPHGVRPSGHPDQSRGVENARRRRREGALVTLTGACLALTLVFLLAAHRWLHMPFPQEGAIYLIPLTVLIV